MIERRSFNERLVTSYFTLRFKQFFRLSKEIGFVRCLFLVGFLSLSVYLLARTEREWIVPTITILGLMFYHNERKDKDFLLLQAKDITTLLEMEYLLIGLPFIIIECLKGYFVGAGLMIMAALLLPYLKTVKWKSAAIPVPFLYKGGLEYIRMFRLYGWLYLLLFLVILIGASHDNIRIGKVALMVWGVIQMESFISIPQRQELTFFLDYATLQRHLVRSSVWNVTVTGIPFVGFILSFSFTWENVLFSACAMMGSMLCLWNVGMVRHLFSSTVTMTIYLLILLIPLFFYSCFIPFLLVPLALINGVSYMLVKDNTKQIWN